MRLILIVIALCLVASPVCSLPFLPMIVSELTKREAPSGGSDSTPSFVQDADPRAEGGGILPGLPSGLGGGSGGDSGGGMMFNQPMAMMGGFTMLMMPAQDAMAMANSFSQFAGSMPQMPGLPG